MTSSTIGYTRTMSIAATTGMSSTRQRPDEVARDHHPLLVPAIDERARDGTQEQVRDGRREEHEPGRDRGPGASRGRAMPSAIWWSRSPNMLMAWPSPERTESGVAAGGGRRDAPGSAPASRGGGAPGTRPPRGRVGRRSGPASPGPRPPPSTTGRPSMAALGSHARASATPQRDAARSRGRLAPQEGREHEPAEADGDGDVADADDVAQDRVPAGARCRRRAPPGAGTPARGPIGQGRGSVGDRSATVSPAISQRRQVDGHPAPLTTTARPLAMTPTITSSSPGCDRLSHSTPATSRNERGVQRQPEGVDDVDVPRDEDLGPEAQDEGADQQRQVAQPDVQQRVQAAARQQPAASPRRRRSGAWRPRARDSLIGSLAGDRATTGRRTTYAAAGSR